MALCRANTQKIDDHTDDDYYDDDDDDAYAGDDLDARSAADDQATYDAGDDYDDADAALGDQAPVGAQTQGKVFLAQRDMERIAGKNSQEVRLMKNRLTKTAGRPAAMKIFSIQVSGPLAKFVGGCTAAVPDSLPIEMFQVKDRKNVGSRFGNPKAVYVARVDVKQINSTLDLPGVFTIGGGGGADFKAKHVVFANGQSMKVHGLIPNASSTQYKHVDTVFTAGQLRFQHHANHRLPSMEDLGNNLKFHVVTLPANGNAGDSKVEVVNIPPDHPILPYLKTTMKERNSSKALVEQRFKTKPVDGSSAEEERTVFCAPSHFVKDTLAFMKAIHDQLKPFDLTKFSVTAKTTATEEVMQLSDTEKARPVVVLFTFAVHYVFA